MSEKDKIYKCNVCGNIVSLIINGGGQLVCCGENMQQLEEKTGPETGNEKHVPVVEISGNDVTVKVGDVPHPMEEAHFIQFVQLLQDGKVIDEQRLFPKQEPVAKFTVKNTENLIAREYCNLHGLWKN